MDSKRRVFAEAELALANCVASKFVIREVGSVSSVQVFEFLEECNFGADYRCIERVNGAVKLTVKFHQFFNLFLGNHE